MSIRLKIVSCFLMVSLLFVFLTVSNYRRTLNTTRQLFLINELFLPLSRIIVQLQGHVHGLAEDLKRLDGLNSDSSQKGTFSRMVRDLYPYLIFRKITLAENLLAKAQASDSRVKLSEVTNQFSALRRIFEGATHVSALAELEPIYRDARHRLQMVSKIVEEQSQNVTSAAQKDAKDNLRWSLILSALFLIIGAISVWVSYRAFRPLPALIESIKQNASGDFLKTLKLSPNENDEFGVLAREYNKMLLALAERDKKIQSQQKELVQAERLATVGKLSAEIVHEIRNPLNAISLNVDWLCSELTEANPAIKQTLRSVAKEIVRLNEITERYLMQARVNEAKETTFDLNEMIRELIDFLKEEHRAKKIQLKEALAAGSLFVRANRSRLRQAFLNILRNSKEAMPNGGTITIQSRIKNNTCEVTIEDTGCGMSETTLKNIFMPFFSTKPNGNGLGLLLTRAAIEECHGSMRLKSKMGTGTCCEVQLPASA